MSEQRSHRRHVTGAVISDKMAKTITVKVDRMTKHPRYHKFLKRSSKFYAHDEKEEAGLGDTVEIAETRPLSRLKRWRLVQVVVRAAGTVKGEQAPQAGETT